MDDAGDAMPGDQRVQAVDVAHIRLDEIDPVGGARHPVDRHDLRATRLEPTAQRMADQPTSARHQNDLVLHHEASALCGPASAGAPAAACSIGSSAASRVRV